MATLKALKARQVLDSRGRPTVEVDAIASTGAVGRAIVPSGASTGRHEALELRDGNPTRYGGLSVFLAVENVTNLIAPLVVGMDLSDQPAIDARLIAADGTPNKSRLGANAVLGVSLAAAHAAAAARGEELFVHLNRLWCQRVATAGAKDIPVEPELPLPMVNMISGGLHAGGNLDIQDVLIMPVGASRYSHALEMTVAIYRAVGRELRKSGCESVLVGDEGGYGPRLDDDEQALAVVKGAVGECGFQPSRDVAIALDVAASHFHDPARGQYKLRAPVDRELGSAEMIDLLAGWAHAYPIVSIEDGLAEDDWDGWAALTARLGGSLQLIGDDLFATQVSRLAQGIARHAGNAVLIKLNQVGTLTETLDAMVMARTHGFRTVVSARSGETEDSTIADLAVATAAGQIKIGSVARSERLAKYNRLLRIEEILGNDARFAGRAAVLPPQISART
ncbi:MAG: phosphopyruvate hydratase [Isosphaeraceae bacterium]